MNIKQLKTLIITCWSLLIICFVIKLLGGNWFELSTNNENFIAFCSWLDNTMVFKIILYCIIAMTTTYPLFCILLNKTHLKLKEGILLCSIIAIKSILCWWFVWVSYVADMIAIVLIPLIYGKFKNWKRVLISNILVMILQLMCMFIRNITFNFATISEVLETLLLQLGYFIMITLCYLYNIYFILKKKEK